MDNSYKFFANRECRYYPCHKGLDNINCLFCFCPMYNYEDCPGNSKYIQVNGKTIKECSDCTFPHHPDNYDSIMKFLTDRKM